MLLGYCSIMMLTRPLYNADTYHSLLLLMTLIYTERVAGVIQTYNGFYCDPPTVPNQPAIFTEMWSGWFQAKGGALPHRPASDVAYAMAKFVAEGGTMFNYYM